MYQTQTYRLQSRYLVALTTLLVIVVLQHINRRLHLRDLPPLCYLHALSNNNRLTGNSLDE